MMNILQSNTSNRYNSNLPCQGYGRCQDYRGNTFNSGLGTSYFSTAIPAALNIHGLNFISLNFISFV